MHIVSFVNVERVVKLCDHFMLSVFTLEDRQRIDIWMSDCMDWEPTTVRSRIKVHPNVDTLLVRLPEVEVAAGMGDALIHLERSITPRRESHQSQAAVKWRVRVSSPSQSAVQQHVLTACKLQEQIAVALSVTPVYDVAIPSAVLNRRTRLLLRRLGPIQYEGSSCSYAPQSDKMTLGKREADSVSSGSVAKKARHS